jgi:hypothetical protein
LGSPSITTYWQGRNALYTSAHPAEMPWSELQLWKRPVALAFGPMRSMSIAQNACL